MSIEEAFSHIAEYPEDTIMKAMTITAKIINEVKRERDTGNSGYQSCERIKEILSTAGYDVNDEDAKQGIFKAMQTYINALELKAGCREAVAGAK